ncbi:MAG: glycerate kinase [Segetibacter sp.]
MHILIAPNAFKNSLNANDAAEAIKSGLMQSKLQCTTECFPIADGGDGTAELIIKKCGGQIAAATVEDPLRRNINASFGLIDKGTTAVIEMADASGLRLLKNDELDPLHATSYGTGELIKHALDKGVSKIIIAMGGSATVDGGTGILDALGARFLNAEGEVLSKMPESLVNLSRIDLSKIDERVYQCSFFVLCDVDNKLLGSEGAAAVFGPQKGASGEEVKMLEISLEKFAAIAFQQTGKDLSQTKYGGTADGAAAGLYTFLNAELVNGIDHFLQLTHFSEELAKSDIVITGEGSIDEQTLQGKGPFGVADRAKKKGVEVIGLAGKVPLNRHQDLMQYFDVLIPIGNEPSDIKTALQSATANLERTAIEVGNLLAMKYGK